MPTHEPKPNIETATTFERKLEALLLESFARGMPVEGTFDISTPVADAPDWSITIKKRVSNESSGYEPQFLEE